MNTERFLLRPAQARDIEDILELSKMLSFINLPAKRELLEEKVALSQNSFAHPCQNREQNSYLFILEDLSEKKVIGTSAICGKHGTDNAPHFFFRVYNQRKYSSTIKREFTHQMLAFGVETNGYSEIGGLMLHPHYRRNSSKLGKQMSFVRFLYMALNPLAFTDEIHTELMPPFDRDGQSPLWEAIGRKFFKMDYLTADELSRKNKEFILSLFPREPIFVAMLPQKAKDAIGRVGEQTRPVVKMLEDIGFRYMEEIDPFDGGPHYRCSKDKILPIKNFFRGSCHPSSSGQRENLSPFLITWKRDGENFSARATLATVDSSAKKLFLPSEQLKKLNLTEGEEVGAIRF